MTEFQELLLETFKAFHKFCEEKNITYYAGFGTALGAYRHKGFIPWDDDIDVVMKRDDYNKFIALSEELQNTTQYKISHIFEGKYRNLFAKFHSTKQTIWERRHIPVIYGPWVDVFPIDLDDRENPHQDLFDQTAATWWKYKKTIERITWKEIWYDLVHRRGLNPLLKTNMKLFSSIPRTYYSKKLKSLIKKAADIKDGDCYTRYGWLTVKYSRECFDNPPVLLQFEDTFINVPYNIEKHLEEVFGPNYMTPPPVEKQVSNHKDMFYVNLNRSMTIKEVIAERGDEYGTDPVYHISSFLGLSKQKYMGQNWFAENINNKNK